MTQADDTGGVLGRQRRALTIGLLLAIGAFAVEGMGVVPALPTALRQLGGLGYFGWAFSGFMLAFLAGTVAGGLLADARGPRLPMMVGLSGFGGGLLVAAAAQDVVTFMAGRALQGAGGGAMIAATYVAIARGYPDKLRARMMALSASVWVIPAILGPVVSGAVAQWASWRYVFAGVIPLLLVTAILVFGPLKQFEVRVPPASLSRVWAALRMAAGAGILLAIPDANRLGGLAAGIGAAAVGAILLFPAIKQLLPAGTLRGAPGLPAGLAARGLLSFAYFGTEAFVPLGAGQLRGATATEAGLALTAGALGWISASWFQDRVEARPNGAEGREHRVMVGFLLVAAGIALVATGLLTTLPEQLVLLGWAVAGAGMGLGYSATSLLCIAAAPAGREGEVSGQIQIAEALSTATATGGGGALLVALAQIGRTPREANGTLFAITLAAALLGVAVTRRAAAPRR